MIKAKDEVEEVLGQLDIPLSAAQRLTERRTLAAPPGRASPKDALWLRRHLQNASLREASYEKTHSGCSGARKMRLYVTSNPRMRFSVECAFPHLGKRGAGSRKSALCPDGLTEKRTLRSSPIGKTQFGVASYGKAHSVGLGGCRLRFSVTSPPGRRGTQPPASLRGTMENGPTGQTRSSNPPARLRGGCAGARRPQPGARPHGKAQSGQRASLMERPGPGRDTIGLPGCGLRRSRELRIRVCAQQTQPTSLSAVWYVVFWW